MPEVNCRSEDEVNDWKPFHARSQYQNVEVPHFHKEKDVMHSLKDLHHNLYLNPLKVVQDYRSWEKER
jgi:hypothetical protein